MSVAGQVPHLFCFGYGFSASRLARLLMAEGWRVSATYRRPESRRILAADGVRGVLFDRGRPIANIGDAFDGVTDVLSSIPPDGEGPEGRDPVLDERGADIARLDRLRWVGYLSTTGVYGDTGGTLADESTPLHPTSLRSRRRVAAEARWLALHRDHGLPVHVFRLAGIYGPGRSAVDQVRAGQARRVHREGFLFSRIHVDDVAQVLRASIARLDAGAIYNVCDDLPAAQADVIAFACELLGVDPPPVLPFDEAVAHMSPMARSFWQDNRRIDNRRIKRDLNVRLRYPDYRQGLAAVLAGEVLAGNGDAADEDTVRS